jgi:hypothetical protein
MTRSLRILVAIAALAAAGSALAATPSWVSFSPGSTTAGVATLELVDPVLWSGRSIPARNGVYFGFCDRGPLRPCALGWGAFTARRQAFSLAQTTFRDTTADVVVVGLPQSRTRYALLVFERDVLSAPDLDPLAATAARVYAMGGLVTFSETEDSLLLVRLRPSPAARWDR